MIINRKHRPPDRISITAIGGGDSVRPHSSGPGGGTAPPTRPIRAMLKDLASDLAYLELKEQLGELAPSERARLDAARSGSGPDRAGGGG